jgi:hypothetical protein
MGTGIPDLSSMVNGIVTFVRGTAQGLEIGEVEKRLLPRVRDVGRAALEEFVAVKGTGYTGCGDCRDCGQKGDRHWQTQGRRSGL